MKEALKQIVLSEEKFSKEYCVSYRIDYQRGEDKYVEHFNALGLKDHYVVFNTFASGDNFILDVCHELNEADLSAYNFAKETASAKAMGGHMPFVDKTKHAKDKK